MTVILTGYKWRKGEDKVERRERVRGGGENGESKGKAGVRGEIGGVRGEIGGRLERVRKSEGV